MPQTKINFGVLGAGGIALRKTIPGMLRARNCRLAAVMDPANLDRVTAAFPAARAYERERDLLDDPQVEAVYIASPANCHARQIVAAAEAGKHVLCEKPLCLSVAEAKRAVASCRRQRVFLQEGYMMKFHAAHAWIKEAIDAGRLGKIVSMRAQLSCWYPKIAGAWRQSPRTGGGGALIDMASHLFDLLEHFAGPVRRVAARTGNLVQDYASEDASTTLLEFASGALGTVDCFYCIPDEASRTRLEIYGSCGAVLAEGTIGQGSGGRLEAIFGPGDAAYDTGQSKDAAAKFRRVSYPKINPYTAECSYFADCILAGRGPEINDGRNALRMMRLIEAAYRSARTKKMVSVSQS